MELDLCRYCNYVGKNRSSTSTHIHTKHPGMDCINYHCWTCGTTFKIESGLKRLNTTVQHILEVKRFKESTEWMDISTLWDITPTNERYLTFIDYINPEQTQPRPERFFKIAPNINKINVPIKIPLEKSGETSDPRPEVGIYKKIKFTPKTIKDKDMPASFPTPDTPDTPDTPLFIIKEKDNSLKYIPDHVADDLMNNLIKFMDEHSSTEIIFEEEKSDEDTQIHPNTPEISFQTEDLGDILTDESWLTLDMIGDTPTLEDIFPHTMKILKTSSTR